MVLRKRNYTSYKEELPLIELSTMQYQYLGKGMAVVKKTRGGKREKIRIRIKPKKKLSLQQENKLLKKQLEKLMKEKGN